MKTRHYTLVALISLSATIAFALSPDERTFFGLTALESTHPELNGSGFSFAVSDTEFDITHPGLGWVSSETYAQWSNTTNPIPDLIAKNPRIWSAANAHFNTASYTNRHHGDTFYSFNLPIRNNNTIPNFVWGIHGTAVAGTAGSNANGPLGNSRGVAPSARLVLASDTENFGLAAGQVPDGNPFKTVAINRSFTGSSSLLPAARVNSGLTTVNAAGNDFGGENVYRTYTYGMSPQLASVRWLSEKGYDIIASGFFDVTSNQTFNAPYGSMRSTESIWTDYQVTTLSPDGAMDAPWGGTSFASPFTVGCVTLLQQAYANSHSGRWARSDQLLRILRRTARFSDDQYTGLRCPGVDMAAAVTLATNYVGDPSFEPNFTDDFSDTNHLNMFECPSYPNPRRFRTDIAYGAGTYDFTGPRTYYNIMGFGGSDGPGRCNVALRNDWGDLAVVDLRQPGKRVAITFDFDTNPGFISGITETYVGFKEMVGSDQFMDGNRETDSEAIGRVAFKITAFQGSDQCTVQALRCMEIPDTNDVLWARTNLWVVPAWDSPLTSVIVTNLTLGHFPNLTFEFTATTMRFLRDGQEILNVAHGAPAFALERSTPYFHFQHSNTDHVTRIKNFAVRTTASANPVVSATVRRGRALEGMPGAAADGIVSISRGIATNTPLTVSYIVSGSASNGVDYSALSGSVTIPANAVSVDIAVHPLNDGIAEPDESIALTLVTGPGYTLGDIYKANVVILDMSDADGDGLANTNENINANGDLLDDDTDADMLPNYLDADDDGDGVSTAMEDRNHNGDPRDDDTDTDSTPDYLDQDDDGDGVSTLREDRNRNGDPTDDDYDHDGLPDYLDTDPAPYSDFGSVNLAGTFNGWNIYGAPMNLISNSLWQQDYYFVGTTGVEFKFAAEHDWIVNWGDDQQNDITIPISDVASPGGQNIRIDGTLNGTYRFKFDDASLAYSVAFVPPTDNDADGMADDWEIAHGLNPSNPGDANGDPDLDGFTNLEEFQRGTDPHVWNPRLTGFANMSVAATFNNWDAGANNMTLVDDYVWRFVGTFRAVSNVQFKFTANGNWTTNWGDNNAPGVSLPLTNAVAEQGGANIVITNVLDGIYAFTFNEQTRAYSVSETCDDFCALVSGIGHIMSPGVPGPVMGGGDATWRAIAGGDEDTSTPSGFALARKYGGGRAVMLGHDGLIQNLGALDNRAFMVNVMEWLNNAGPGQVAYTEGHGEWVKGPQLSALAAEMAGHGFSFSSITGEISAATLSGKNILIIGNAWQMFAYNEYNAVQSFVSNGGGVLLLGLGWSWGGVFDDYPMNRMGEYFQARWLRGYISDATDNTNGSPVFHTFYPRVPYFDFNEATGRIAAIHAAHPADLPLTLENDALVRRDYLVAQGSLGAVSSDFMPYATERNILHNFCSSQASNYPNYFSKTNYFNPATRPVMSRTRERFMRTWVGADYPYASFKLQIGDIGRFTGGYSNIWNDYSVYLADNRSLNATQITSLYSCLSMIPPDLHNLRVVTVNDFIGGTTPAVSLDGRDGQVNIFGLNVGAATENPFPFDVAARTSDVFAAVAAHEFNHVVDAYAISASDRLNARKSQLIADAGTNRFHYLRGGDGLGLGNGFFTQNPQEFFASIANQWFTDSEQVFELGYARFTNGIPHPMNQAVFFADVYSQARNSTRLFAMSPNGQFTRKDALIVRNTNGYITAISSDRATWFFGVDASGNVTNVVRTDGTADQDSDGMADRWEIEFNFDPFFAGDATEDPDHDGLANALEFTAGTNPHFDDTDHDGTSDLLDSQPLAPAYPQVTVAASSLGTAQKVTFWWTSYYLYYDSATWGTPSYYVTEGFAKFNVSAIPDNAVIRNVAMVYDTGTYKYEYTPADVDTEVVDFYSVDPAPPADAEMIFNAISTGQVVRTISGTNEFPFANWKRGAVNWGSAVEANLASRLAADTWMLGFRSGPHNNYYYALVSNMTLVVSYETNGPYSSPYSAMTMAGTLNGWNPVANNMILISNHTWRFVGDVRNASGVQIKFAANRSWGVNWGDNDQSDFDAPITNTCESSGNNIGINGVIDGTLRVTFNDQTAVYSVEILPRTDTDNDGMPDDWEIANGLNPGLNDANGNPDGDNYSNLEEYRNGTDPRVWNPPASEYEGMAVAGTFNDWDAGSMNMTLVSNFTWQFELPVTNVISLQFKFAANGAWGTNWGDNDQSGLLLPIGGTAEREGANVQINGPVDGMLRFTFFEGSAQYTVVLIPPLDSDSDGMPDYWEDLYALDKGFSGDASLDSDSDGIINLDEYHRRTNPRVPDRLDSNYASMTAAGDFNGWNAGANNMHLVDNYTWKYTVGLDVPAGVELKFAANGSWDINWGDTNQPPGHVPPVSGIGDTNGPNIAVAGPLNGTYVLLFNELTRTYSFTQSQVADFDQDGIPDDWESAHGFNPRDGADGSIDSDGDQLTNLEEYHNATDPHDADTDDDGVSDRDEIIAGTKASDASSYFRTHTTETGGVLRISWPGASGRTYSVMQLSNMYSTAWMPLPDHTNLSGQSGTMYEWVTAPDGEMSFYTISVRKNAP